MIDKRALVPRQASRDSSKHAGSGMSGRRGGRVAMAVLGAVIALIAVSVAAAGGASSAAAGQLETVTIATPPFEPTALVFYANARGLFRKHGIDAKLAVTADPGAGVAAMLAGDAQFSAIHAGGPALLRSKGAPVRLVAAGALYQRSAATAGLVSARGKRFAAPRELMGKRVGYDAPGTIAHVALMKWLKQGGVRESDLTLVRAAFPDMIGALARGDVDAAVLPEPFLTVAKKQGGKLVAPIFQSVCVSECLLTAWIARSDVDRNLAARFRNAIQEAAAWANRQQNDAASGAILARYANIERGLLRAMARSRFAIRLRLPRIQPWIDAYKEFGLIPETFTAGDLVK